MGHSGIGRLLTSNLCTLLRQRQVKKASDRADEPFSVERESNKTGSLVVCPLLLVRLTGEMLLPTFRCCRTVDHRGGGAGMSTSTIVSFSVSTRPGLLHVIPGPRSKD